MPRRLAKLAPFRQLCLPSKEGPALEALSSPTLQYFASPSDNEPLRQPDLPGIFPDLQRSAAFPPELSEPRLRGQPPKLPWPHHTWMPHCAPGAPRWPPSCPESSSLSPRSPQPQPVQRRSASPGSPCLHPGQARQSAPCHRHLLCPTAIPILLQKRRQRVPEASHPARHHQQYRQCRNPPRSFPHAEGTEGTESGEPSGGLLPDR
mmetsp:Transcript_28794/g.62796  ORF Transcript_28794/g.62796 Transcript_28794/m.62796 type:complete len:206 (-) Transcript_28794:143-760(-)